MSAGRRGDRSPAGRLLAWHVRDVHTVGGRFVSVRPTARTLEQHNSLAFCLVLLLEIVRLAVQRRGA